MVQVKSGKGRASEEERKVLVEWGKAYQGRVEIWKYKKGKPLEREMIYDAGSVDGMVHDSNDFT